MNKCTQYIGIRPSISAHAPFSLSPLSFTFFSLSLVPLNLPSHLLLISFSIALSNFFRCSLFTLSPSVSVPGGGNTVRYIQFLFQYHVHGSIGPLPPSLNLFFSLLPVHFLVLSLYFTIVISVLSIIDIMSLKQMYKYSTYMHRTVHAMRLNHGNSQKKCENHTYTRKEREGERK